MGPVAVERPWARAPTDTVSHSTAARATDESLIRKIYTYCANGENTAGDAIPKLGTGGIASLQRGAQHLHGATSR
jgi:hypothetical protein